MSISGIKKARNQECLFYYTLTKKLFFMDEKMLGEGAGVISK